MILDIDPIEVHAELQEDELTFSRPDISHLITEDETPVDNRFSEKQMRLLTHALYAGWNPGVPFAAMANVGLYFALNSKYVLVPDVLVSLEVTEPEDLKLKQNRAYMAWEFGKVPDIVIEIVSNKEGGELERKYRIYAHHRVQYYVVYDPDHKIQQQSLRCFQLQGSDYVEMTQHSFPGTQLGLVEWAGEFEGIHECWLRWVDESGSLIPTGVERAAAQEVRAAAQEKRAAMQEKRAATQEKRAAAEEMRANAEAQKAAEQTRHAAALAAKLRELGINPDEITANL